MRKHVLSFLWVCVVSIFMMLVVASPVYAQCANPDDEIDIGFTVLCSGGSADPSSAISTIYGIGLGIIGGVAVLLIIYGGYIILTSSGNPSQLNKGKSYIFYAITGLLLAVFGYVFLDFIARGLLHIPGFG